MKMVCSTKKLNPAGRAYLENNAVGVVVYDAIDIRLLDFDLPGEFDYLIFTSQNAVKSFLRQREKTEVTELKEPRHCFCVGSRTKALLEKNGYEVLKMATNATALGKYLAAAFKPARFVFLCGNRRRDELPDLLKTHGMVLEEVIVYENCPVIKKMPGEFDGVLFFSPTGVDSFFAANSTNGIAFCIGPTTAKAAAKYTDKIAISKIALTEKLLEFAVEKLFEPGYPSS